MKNSKIKVEVTLEVTMVNNWGDDCTLGKMKKQAEGEALRQIESAAEYEGIEVAGTKVVGFDFK